MKLLKVVANNFKLCEDNFTISFVPKANKTLDDKEFELHEISENLYTFTTVGIIGKNASGKTMTVELLSVIYDIFSNFRIKNSIDIFKYINKTVNIDVSFYYNNFLYRYVTDLYKNDLDDTTVLFKNQKLYKREYKKTYDNINKLFDYEKYQEVINNIDLPEDTSIIYTLLKNITIRGIYCPSEDFIYRNYVGAFSLYKTLNNDLNIISFFLRLFDEHLENI